MESGMVSALSEWHVESYDAAFSFYLPHVNEMFCRAAAVAKRWVAHEHLEAHGACLCHHLAAYMTVAHNTDDVFLWRYALFAAQQDEGRTQILRHAAGVASRTVHPAYPCLLHVFCVNVVVADGGGGDELHLAPLQQFLVAACPSSHYQCISVLNVAGRYVGTLQIGNVWAYLAKRLPNIRNLVVNNNLHDS